MSADAGQISSAGETPRPVLGVLHGVLYAPDKAPGQTDDELIAELYARQPTTFVEKLEGEFGLVVVDPARRRIVLATDATGSHPIYWRCDADDFAFASDLSALLLMSAGARRLDLRAVADYLTLGAVLEDRTLVQGVKLLDPGTVLEYDLAQHRVSLRPYLELAAFFGGNAGSRDEYLERVAAEFQRAVGRALAGSGQKGLALSGGLDSRAILGAMNGEASTVRTYTLGVDGCADEVIAARLSRIAGTTHRFFKLDRSYLRDFLPNMSAMVSATDGMYLSHGLTEMLALRFLEDTGIAVLLRGHGGELAKAHLAWPLHTDPRVHQMNSIAELVPYLSRRANYLTPHLPLSEILIDEARAAAGVGSSDSFASVLEAKRLSPADACSYLYLRELNRRFTIPSLELFRTRVEVRLPFLDASFLRVLFAAPPEWREGTVIHRALTASGLPELLHVRNSNTGAAADAGPFAEYVLDKMNTAFRRLHVRGYRHYHDFDAWMRTSLIASVESELLAPAARVQGFVSRSTLTRLIRETREGAADRSYLLQVLLILELWQRENGVEAAA